MSASVSHPQITKNIKLMETNDTVEAMEQTGIKRSKETNTRNYLPTNQGKTHQHQYINTNHRQEDQTGQNIKIMR
jgi:hypothetical protein